MREIVFATNNKHKLTEARQIAGERLKILSLSDIGCHEEIPETSPTLEGNSLQKAQWIKERYGYDCFADDTGLMVDALDGRPGVYSARYAGEGCTPDDNIRKMLKEMEGVTDRGARFRTVVTLIMDGVTRQFSGEVAGEITQEREGESGFGYDPIFKATESGKTFATMTPEAKNEISHRGRAMAQLYEFINKT